MADSAPTPTVFRMFPDGDIIALFPTIPADLNGHCLSYQHVGQHGAADYGHVIANSRPARPAECADLVGELIGIGYAVRPVRRASRRMHEERRSGTRAHDPSFGGAT